MPVKCWPAPCGFLLPLHSRCRGFSKSSIAKESLKYWHLNFEVRCMPKQVQTKVKAKAEVVSNTRRRRRLLYWQPSTGLTVSSQTLVDVMKSIESINGVRTGRWQVTASNHRPIQRDQSMGLPQDTARELLGLTFSEVPSKHYFILRGEHMVVEAHANMQNIMEKLQLYRNRLTVFFEHSMTDFFELLESSQLICKWQGFQYQLGDFQVKAGRAVLAHSENLRGIVLEVEYVPVSSLEQTRLLLQEFVEMWQEVVTAQNMAGRFTHLEPNYSDYNLPDQYSWQHTALQYVTLMVYFMQTQRS